MLSSSKNGDTFNVRDERSSTTPKSSFENLERRKSASSFDFDDDELDDELTRAVDEVWQDGPSAPISATAPPLLHSFHRQYVKTYGETNFNMPHDPTVHNVVKKPAKTVNSGKVNSHSSSAPLSNTNSLRSQPSKIMAMSKQDDFDEDDDVSTADLENVMAVYDTKPPHNTRDVPSATRLRSPNNHQLQSSSAKSASSSVQGAGCDESKMQSELISDDEFGGDFDFEKIIAQCEATQKPQSDLSSSPLVRTLIFSPPT